ncbi:IS3 family transposase [Asanoa sp. NPDC049518]|uniref:IS3 family transposase n=1 Tax=unclassified Asanoa TaxID=2685164 RepID=UPI003413E5B6
MIYPVVVDLAAQGIAIAVACRVLGVSTSGFYDWKDRPPSPRSVADEALGELIADIQHMSRGSYGSPRVHAELRLAAGVRCGRKRVERLMRAAGLEGVYRRRRRGCTIRDPHARPSADLVQRRFTADGPDRLWVTDIERHEAFCNRRWWEATAAGLSQQAGEAEGSSAPGMRGLGGSGPDNDEAGQYCQMARARLARRRGIREEPAAERSSREPPARTWRIWAG